MTCWIDFCEIVCRFFAEQTGGGSRPSGAVKQVGVSVGMGERKASAGALRHRCSLTGKVFQRTQSDRKCIRWNRKVWEGELAAVDTWAVLFTLTVDSQVEFSVVRKPIINIYWMARTFVRRVAEKRPAGGRPKHHFDPRVAPARCRLVTVSPPFAERDYLGFGRAAPENPRAVPECCGGPRRRRTSGPRTENPRTRRSSPRFPRGIPSGGRPEPETGGELVVPFSSQRGDYNKMILCIMYRWNWTTYALPMNAPLWARLLVSHDLKF